MKLRIGLLMLLGAWLHGVAYASESALEPVFKEGIQYTLVTPAPAANEGSDVEVVEFFWYGCPHCNSLEPYMKQWLAKKPENIHFVRIPAPFSGRALLHAKMFYALQAIGEGDRLHDVIFEAMHGEQKVKLDNLDEIVDFLVAHGVDGQKFRSALDSFAVQTQMNRATVLAKRYEIHGVPALIIDGRYKSGKGFTSYAGFTELVDYLAAKVIKERQGAVSTDK